MGGAGRAECSEEILQAISTAFYTVRAAPHAILNNPCLRANNHKRGANTDLFDQVSNRDAAAPLFSGPCVVHAQRNGGRPRPRRRCVAVLEHAVQWSSDVSAHWALSVTAHSSSCPREKERMGARIGPGRLLADRRYNSLPYCWVPDGQFTVVHAHLRPGLSLADPRHTDRGVAGLDEPNESLCNEDGGTISPCRLLVSGCVC